MPVCCLFNLNNVIFMDSITKERTLIILKPDVIQRQIIGEILTRFERKGLKVVAMKLVTPSRELVSKHYSDDKAYLEEVGNKGIVSAKERGEDLGDLTALEIGARVRMWNVEYLSCGPVLAVVLEGAHVIASVRKLIGKSNPVDADVGTIRADFTPDSFLLSNAQGRTTRTMIHASDSVENANREIALWFSKDEILSYETAIEKILYDAGWGKKVE